MPTTYDPDECPECDGDDIETSALSDRLICVDCGHKWLPSEVEADDGSERLVDEYFDEMAMKGDARW